MENRESQVRVFILFNIALKDGALRSAYLRHVVALNRTSTLIENVNTSREYDITQ